MAKLYGEIAAKSLLTLDKSFARANGQPLDASEVYYSLQAAKDYAATAQAYVGQKIVVIENGVVSHYSVEDTAGNIKELGSKPVADGTTIAIGEDGKITLANIADENKTGTYNAVLVNGVLTWTKPSETTVEGLSDLIQALTGRVDTAEADIDALQAAVGVAAKAAVGEEGSEGYEPAVEATGLFKALDEEVARAQAAEKALGERIDGIDFVDEDELAEALEPYAKSADVVDKETYATDKKALEDEDAAIRAIAEGARDALDTFLNSEEIDDTVNTLKEIQAEIDKMTDATELATALASKADISYVDEKLAEKQDVIADGTYATPDDVATAKSEAIADAATAAAGLYATKTELSDAEKAIDERLDVLEAIDHDAYETVENVNLFKELVEETYATKEQLSGVSDKADDNAGLITNLTNRLDGIVAQGGEPNTINTIKVNGVAQVIDGEKAVDIAVPTKFSDITDDSGFDGRISANATAAQTAADAAKEAQDTADEAKAAAEANATALGTLQTTVAGHTTTINEHGSKIAAIETANATHAGEFSALKSTVDGHTTAIAGKAAQTDLDAAVLRVAANETAIKSINETKIPALEAEIAKKADASALANYYTAAQVDAITGTPDEGKTLVQMIKDAQDAATYDDAEVRGLISNNADAIKAIYDAEAETGVLATEIARVEGLVATEEARAKGVEKDFEDRITEMETFWEAADDPEGTIDKLAEIVNYIAADKSGALDMAADIQENANAIAALYTAADGETPASGVLVTEITRVEGKADANALAIEAINNETTGILAQANTYTDNALAALPAATAEALGLVKYDDDTIKMNDDKQLYVAKVSTDVLVNGAEEFILFGGTAQ